MFHSPPRVLAIRSSVFHPEAEILSRDFESGLFMVDGGASIEILGPSGCSVSPQLIDKLLSAGGMSIKGVLPPSIDPSLSESPLVCRRRLAAADDCCGGIGGRWSICRIRALSICRHSAWSSNLSSSSAMR